MEETIDEYRPLAQHRGRSPISSEPLLAYGASLAIRAQSGEKIYIDIDIDYRLQ